MAISLGRRDELILISMSSMTGIAFFERRVRVTGIALLFAIPLFWDRGEQRAIAAEQAAVKRLVGCWELIRSAVQPMEPAETDFRSDGRLFYSVLSEGRWQIMKLTYRVEGDYLVTDQPSHPRTERTRFRLESDGTLMLEFGGQKSWFRRGKKRAPEP